MNEHDLGIRGQEDLEQSTEALSEKEPEGYENTSNQGSDEDYPLDSVMVRPQNISVSDVMKRIKSQRLIMDPDFQREFVWDSTRQSRLIESCIMRIPLPVLYLAEAEDGRVMVVDGLQRLSTFARYTDNKFGLFSSRKSGEETKKNELLLNKKFKDLPPHLQERISDTQLTLYILDKSAPVRAKLDIFDRVNSGVPISRQQMRNSLYCGNATRWLKERAESQAFKKATGGSLNAKTMRNREAINRFCGFYLLKNKYTGDMDTFLANALDHMNKMSQQGLDALAASFENSMNNNISLFGDHAFRKSFASDNSNRDRAVINIALFDVYSVLLADVDPAILEAQKDYILEKSKRLILSDSDFSKAITLATNGKSQVETRFAKVEEIINNLSRRELELC